MSDHELPTVADKGAVCHIDFEFQMPYHEPLTSKELLQQCISLATTDVLHNAKLTLDISNIDIPEIDLRPSDTNPKRIKVGGWITCPDNHRQVYMDALQLAQQSKKISKQIIAKTNIKRTKVQIQQFTTRFSNAHHVNKSFVDSTEASFHKFKKILSNNSVDIDSEEKKQTQTNTNTNTEEPPQTPPLTSLAGTESVIVHDIANDSDLKQDTTVDTTNDTGNSEEEYDIVNVKSQTNNTTDTTEDSSFQMVDGLDNENDQSSNEEHKSSDDNFDTEPEFDPIKRATSTNQLYGTEVEVIQLKAEVEQLKQQHAEELTHFQNKMHSMNKERKIERQRSRISMQIDDEILQKQIKQDVDDKVSQLESEMSLKENKSAAILHQLQLRHTSELQKFDYKLRHTQQVHTLELGNVRDAHKYETEQLQSQIRGLTGALERESQKDRSLYKLTEENEQLKADKDRIIANYESTIEKLNNDSEDSIRQEIDKRIKETAAFKRRINDLQQKMEREDNIKNRLETQLSQLESELDSKDSMINQIRDMFIKEKKKAAIFEQKLMRAGNSRSRKNVLNESKKERKKEAILNKGGHLRKKSKTLKNVIIDTQKDIETGDTIITLNKTNEPLNILDQMKESDLWDLDGILSDSDGEYDDTKQQRAMTGVTMDKSQHDEEIRLKEQQIQALNGKIRNLKNELGVIKEENHKELQVLQQKIGSLQQSIEMNDENFLKQNQMLEFKLKKKENDSKKLSEDLQDLKRAHRKELRIVNDEAEKNKQIYGEKDRVIANLESNIDMLEMENGRLKENDQIIADYEAEFEEIDNHYQAMLDDQLAEIREQNEQTQTQFQEMVTKREMENTELKTEVRTQRTSIVHLESLLQSMNETEEAMVAKIEKINELESPNKKGKKRRQSVEVSVAERESKSSDESGSESAQAQGQGQAEIERPVSMHSANDKKRDSYSSDNNVINDGIDLDNYVLKEHMNAIIAQRVSEEKDQYQMEHALTVDTIESKYKQKIASIERKSAEELGRVTAVNHELETSKNRLSDRVNELERRVSSVEEDKIKLLHNFMREMDRMRDEIRKLNAKNKSLNKR